jgi:hypothetical protein
MYREVSVIQLHINLSSLHSWLTDQQESERVSGSVKIVAVITYIECPHCSVPQMGFINDPRGGSFDCDGCGKAFEVPEDAEIDFG